MHPTNVSAAHSMLIFGTLAALSPALLQLSFQNRLQACCLDNIELLPRVGHTHMQNHGRGKGLPAGFRSMCSTQRCAVSTLQHTQG